MQASKLVYIETYIHAEAFFHVFVYESSNHFDSPTLGRPAGCGYRTSEVTLRNWNKNLPSIFKFKSVRRRYIKKQPYSLYLSLNV
jgi:hypothetical protein